MSKKIGFVEAVEQMGGVRAVSLVWGVPQYRVRAWIAAEAVPWPELAWTLARMTDACPGAVLAHFTGCADAAAVANLRKVLA